jgi:hypothetical protein
VAQTGGERHTGINTNIVEDELEVHVFGVCRDTNMGFE